MTNRPLQPWTFVAFAIALASRAYTAGEPAQQHSKPEGMVIVAPERFYKGLLPFRNYR